MSSENPQKSDKLEADKLEALGKKVAPRSEGRQSRSGGTYRPPRPRGQNSRHRFSDRAPEPRIPLDQIPAWAKDPAHKEKMRQDAIKQTRIWQSKGEYTWASQWRSYAKFIYKARPDQLMSATPPTNMTKDSMKEYQPRSSPPIVTISMDELKRAHQKLY